VGFPCSPSVCASAFDVMIYEIDEGMMQLLYVCCLDRMRRGYSGARVGGDLYGGCWLYMSLESVVMFCDFVVVV
jgi:hypothetical protein